MLRPMTYPRAHLVDAENGGIYHCISRCVRRAWLCGKDPVTGFDYEHRRVWLEAQILRLCELFAVDLYAYAIISNHYHLIAETFPTRVLGWTDREVARRWCEIGLEPGCVVSERQLNKLLSDAPRLVELRKRLGSLSWLMRYLNEPLARLANDEDQVTGRFWEGRFKSIALLDEAAVLACMAYVDLNPVRANLAGRPAEAEHTSIARRLRSDDQDASPLVPTITLGLTLAQYAELLEWTVAEERSEPHLPSDVKGPLSRHGIQPERWRDRVNANHRKFRAMGSVANLATYAQNTGQRWVCAVRFR